MLRPELLAAPGQGSSHSGDEQGGATGRGSSRLAPHAEGLSRPKVPGLFQEGTVSQGQLMLRRFSSVPQRFSETPKPRVESVGRDAGAPTAGDSPARIRQDHQRDLCFSLSLSGLDQRWGRGQNVFNAKANSLNPLSPPAVIGGQAQEVPECDTCRHPSCHSGKKGTWPRREEAPSVLPQLSRIALLAWPARTTQLVVLSQAPKGRWFYSLGQVTYSGFGFGPQLECIWEAVVQSFPFRSMSLSLSQKLTKTYIFNKDF